MQIMDMAMTACQCGVIGGNGCAIRVRDVDNGSVYAYARAEGE